MCICDKPHINGQGLYKWQPQDRGMTLKPTRWPLEDGDSLIYDEPGRCTIGTDCHSHDFALVAKGQLGREGSYEVWCHNGSGLHKNPLNALTKDKDSIALSLKHLDSDSRYRVLWCLYATVEAAYRKGLSDEREGWTKAALQKRIKVRSRNKRKYVQIDMEVVEAAAEV